MPDELDIDLLRYSAPKSKTIEPVATEIISLNDEYISSVNQYNKDKLSLQSIHHYITLRLKSINLVNDLCNDDAEESLFEFQNLSDQLQEFLNNAQQSLNNIPKITHERELLQMPLERQFITSRQLIMHKLMHVCEKIQKYLFNTALQKRADKAQQYINAKLDNMQQQTDNFSDEIMHALGVTDTNILAALNSAQSLTIADINSKYKQTFKHLKILKQAGRTDTVMTIETRLLELETQHRATLLWPFTYIIKASSNINEKLYQIQQLLMHENISEANLLIAENQLQNIKINLAQHRASIMHKQIRAIDGKHTAEHLNYAYNLLEKYHQLYKVCADNRIARVKAVPIVNVRSAAIVATSVVRSTTSPDYKNLDAITDANTLLNMYNKFFRVASNRKKPHGYINNPYYDADAARNLLGSVYARLCAVRA